MTITVVLADDQPLVREGLRLILSSATDIDVVGEAGDGSEAVTLARELEPDLVLMDVRMPVLDGIEATRRITGAGLPTRVLMLTTYDLDEHLYDAVLAGAAGYVLKSTPTRSFLATVRAAATGDTVLAPAITRRLLDRFAQSHREVRPGDASAALEGLSDREHAVLSLMAGGLKNDEIAGSLFISAATVKSHVNAIFRKLGARDRVHAVILAYESGFVRPGSAASRPPAPGGPTDPPWP